MFANRSAVLYHQQKYDEALKEIERAIANGYPQDMMYKLKERKARCLLAKKNLKEALQAFQDTVQALDDSKLPTERHLKLERDAQIMIKMLQKNIEMEEKIMKKSKGHDATKDKSKDVIVDHFVCDSLGFDFSEAEGRFAIAKNEIKLGTYLVQEKPHASCLLQLYSQTHCQYCFKRTNVPISCSNCADIVSEMKKIFEDEKEKKNLHFELLIYFFAGLLFGNLS